MSDSSFQVPPIASDTAALGPPPGAPTFSAPASFTERAAAVADTVRTHTTLALANVKAFFVSRSATFWIVFGLALAVLLGFVLYYVITYKRLWNRYIDCTGCYLRYKDQNANIMDRMPIDAQLLTNPQSGYTYSAWLYLANYYGNTGYNKWKPLYVRADIPEGCSNLEWDKVAFQQPGIWLANNQNFVRVVVTTSAYLPASCEGDAAEGFRNYAARDDALMEAFSNADLTDDPSCSVDATSSGPPDNTYILEHADILDVPIGQWFQLCVVVTPRRMELYMNGKLVKTHVFVGVCEMNDDRCLNENAYFAPGETRYTARITNFRYMPLVVPTQMIRLLHDVERRNHVLALKNPLNPLEDASSYGV